MFSHVELELDSSVETALQTALDTFMREDVCNLLVSHAGQLIAKLVPGRHTQCISSMPYQSLLICYVSGFITSIASESVGVSCCPWTALRRTRDFKFMFPFM